MPNLLFDLDGTLTDSRTGIARCYAHALGALGRDAPPEADLTRFVGPPIRHCFATLLATEDPALIERGVDAYRERFEPIGMFENELYPGVADTLAALSARHRLYVVTAKPQVYAERILEHFDIRRRFGAVYGPQLGQREYSKGTLIRAALAGERLDPAETWMIGDRGEDLAGARENGVRAVAAMWGYGTREELERAQPDRVAHAIADLLSLDTPR